MKTYEEFLAECYEIEDEFWKNEWENEINDYWVDYYKNFDF